MKARVSLATLRRLEALEGRNDEDRPRESVLVVPQIERDIDAWSKRATDYYASRAAAEAADRAISDAEYERRRQEHLKR